MITKRKSIIISALLLIVIIAGLLVPQSKYMFKSIDDVRNSKKEVVIYIDENQKNIPKELGTVYINKDRRTMVPLRFVSENLGHDVKWDQKTKTVNIDNGKIKMTIGSNQPIVNSEAIKIDTEAVLVAQRTYVPVRFISEALGYRVLYGKNDDRNAVFIYKNMKPSEAVLDAMVNDVIDLDVLDFNKNKPGKDEGIKEDGTFKNVVGGKTHNSPGYIVEDDGYNNRQFKIKKVSGDWPSDFPAPIFHLSGTDNSFNLVLASMELYGPYLEGATRKTTFRDEQSIYNILHLMSPDGQKIDRNRETLLKVKDPSPVVFRIHSGEIVTGYTTDKTLAQWPKNNLFKTEVVISATDKRTGKPFTVKYHVDFNMKK